jgi:uncharacterized protein (DUF427 family)
MSKAFWKGVMIAESDACIVIEGNHYFPPDSIRREYFVASDTHTVCPWKGTASYYDVVVDGDVKKDAAWSYTDPKDAALEIKDYVAFWRGITIED